MTIKQALWGVSLTIAAATAATGCETARYTEAFEPEGDITHIVVRSDSGAVELVSGSVLRVERTIRAPEGALDLSHQVELSEDGTGETLVLEAHCTPLIPCAVDMRVEVPAGVSVTVALGSGDVWASGLSALAAEISRGDLSVEHLGALSAQIGMGSVQAILAADVDATIAVGHGNVELTVPAGLWFLNAEADSVLIDADILPAEAGEEAQAAGRLELIAPAGQVTVRTEGPQG